MQVGPEAFGTIDVACMHTQRLLDAAPVLAVEQANEILKHSPGHPTALLLHGLALGRVGRGDEAAQALRHALELHPDLCGGWLALGDQLTANGDADAADAAYARHIKSSTRDPKLLMPA